MTVSGKFEKDPAIDALIEAEVEIWKESARKEQLEEDADPQYWDKQRAKWLP